MEELNLREQNERVARVFRADGVSKVQFTSCGNSIASGYAMASETKPLLYRNLSLAPIFREYHLGLRLNHMSRFENNSDENVLEWLVTNLSQEDMNGFARVDDEMMGKVGPKLTEEQLDKYYSRDLGDCNRGFCDVVQMNGKGIANVIFYHGATGSFLDNWTRHGVVAHRAMAGIKRDCSSIDAFLKYVQIMNRVYGSNTQVYLCGAPRVCPIPISDLAINRKLMKMSQNYANVCYVPSISRNYFYDLENEEKSYDVHYDEVDYEALNAQMMKSVADNYSSVQRLISLDRDLLMRSRQVEMGQIPRDYDGNEEYVREQVLDRSLELEGLGVDSSQFLDRAKTYVKNRSPHDFYYLSNRNVGKLI